MVVLLAGGVATFGFWDTPPGWRVELRGLAGTAGLVSAAIGVLLWRRRRETAPGGAEQRPSSPDRKKMLERVRRRCIDDGLDRSLKTQSMRVLGLDPSREPVPLRMRRPGSNEEFPDDTTVSQVFNAANGRLVILGPPGSGKTTALLELTRYLLTLAENDEEQPIPVVFNLSSWSKLTLAEWLIEELHHSYEIPTRIATWWVHRGGILPLLDGLDEVGPDDVRGDCVTAINAFLAKPKVQFALCASTEVPLCLGKSVVLQSLQPDQVHGYLDRVGLGDVRAALETDESLRELVESRLKLCIVGLAYGGKTAKSLLQAPSEQREKQLFEDYAERMFKRQPLTDRLYDENRAQRWLTWLARTIRKPGEFDLDRLQPTCLPTALQRRLVTIVPAAVSAVVGGWLMVLAVKLAGCLAGPWPCAHAGRCARRRAAQRPGVRARCRGWWAD